MIQENEATYYVLKENGTQISGKFENKLLAEMEKTNMDSDRQKNVTVEMVTENNKQVLFG